MFEKDVPPWELEASTKLQILSNKILQILIKNMNFIFIHSIAQFLSPTTLTQTRIPQNLS